MESRKIVRMYLFTQKKRRCRPNSLVDTAGEGEGWTRQESSSDAYTLSGVIDTLSVTDTLSVKQIAGSCGLTYGVQPDAL